MVKCQRGGWITAAVINWIRFHSDQQAELLLFSAQASATTRRRWNKGLTPANNAEV